MRLLLSIGCMIVLISTVCSQATPEGSIEIDWTESYWIWYPEQTDATIAAPPGKRYFRHVFDLPESKVVRRAFLLVTVDNSCTVYLNGEERGMANQWKVISRILLRPALKPGPNVIAIEAVNEGTDPSPAGILGNIVIEYVDEPEPRIIPIDARWKTARQFAEGWTELGYDDTRWVAPDRVALYGLGPWGTVASPDSGRRIPDDFPHFMVPDKEGYGQQLRELFYMYYGTGTGGTLWDGWGPKSTLWPAGRAAEVVRRNWRKMLASRRIDTEGHVSSHQHPGFAHDYGWPFPLWTQTGGIGWQFSLTGLPHFWQEPHIHAFGIHRTTSIDGWALIGITKDGIDSRTGLKLTLEAPHATLTTPTFKVDSFVSPFLGLEWQAEGLADDSSPYVEWTTEHEPDFSPDRRMYFSPIRASDGFVTTMIPVHRLPAWKGTITHLRFSFVNEHPAKLTVKKLYTASDSRHNINNFAYLQGCMDYFNWTRDLVFIRENIQKIRLALRYALDEFQVDRYKCVYTPWVGHDGRSGISRDPNGVVIIHHGIGVGNNYWDLLPFGGKDPLATIYCFDVLKRMAELEMFIADHPEWNIPGGSLRFCPDKLRRLAAEVKAHAGQLFWNEDTGRFAASLSLERDHQPFDYGFTFLNTEAVYYGFATDKQAASIMDWISGRRVVNGDTSQGEDIYHWQFAARATTKRNLDYYGFYWPGPESYPWGGQVQDGGGVLGFSYFDIMSRLKVYGPDDAWERLRTILVWFKETQDEGGFRAYYTKPDRGTLQGGGTAGGLGVDMEFAESVLVPQAMLYGFMGFRPRPDGFEINPRLPSDFSSLTITQIHLHGIVVEVTVTDQTVKIKATQPSSTQLTLFLPDGRWDIRTLDEHSEIAGTQETRIVDKSNPGIKLELDKDRVIVAKRRKDR